MDGRTDGRTDGDWSLIDGKRIMTRHDCKPGVTSLWISVSSTNQSSVLLRYDLSRYLRSDQNGCFL